MKKGIVKKLTIGMKHNIDTIPEYPFLLVTMYNGMPYKSEKIINGTNCIIASILSPYFCVKSIRHPEQLLYEEHY